MTANNNRAIYWTTIALLAAAGIPGILMRFSGIHLPPPFDAPLAQALIFGIGIIGAAFLLSWAAEIAQMDVSASFAIAILALIAVMPEYTIEAVLAWGAGVSFMAEGMPSVPTKEMQLTAANVTGANRLLIGVGWALVIIIFWLKRRSTLDMRGLLNLELPMLVVATLLTLAVFAFRAIPIWLAAVFIGAYIFYLWRSSTQEAEEPELMGAAAMIGSFRPLYRRLWVLAMFIFSAAIILIAADPFVHKLEAAGAEFGISEFLIIQWIAPLASESPEIIVATLFSLRARGADGLTTLISSQVNQLTLLVGSVVIIFSIAAGGPFNFPLDSLQSSEFLLTAATSAFAILLIATRMVKAWHGLVLLTLFVAYLILLLAFFSADIDNPSIRYAYSALTFALTGLMVALNWRRLIYVLRGVPPDQNAP